MRVVLASKSPRRKELLGKIFESFEIISREVDEELPFGIHPCRGVELLAIRKGRTVAEELAPEALVISSDTLVELEGRALGKPRSCAEAYEMLSALSGRQHNVHTGVAVHFKGRVFSGVATTAVCFKELNEEQILRYIDTGEPMDKAGAYGIQGKGGELVEGYEGDFDTVVGLSVSLTKRLIAEATGEGGDAND